MGAESIIITDRANLVQGLDKGLAIMREPTHPYLEVWTLVFWKLEGTGRQNVNIVWMPSHKTRTWLGNKGYPA
eukprot:7110050-Pyramimonas_sp.AAC.1